MSLVIIREKCATIVNDCQIVGLRVKYNFGDFKTSKNMKPLTKKFFQEKEKSILSVSHKKILAIKYNGFTIKVLKVGTKSFWLVCLFHLIK